LKTRISIAASVLAASLAALMLLAGPSSARSTASLKGAGSSFVFPLVSQWTTNYKGATISYNPVGSGAGIAAITNRQVDFGASDAPLSSDQFRDCKGCVQIPWALSATSVAYNLDGAPAHLKISGKVVADIYLGKITRWNDSRIAKLNKGVSLPNEKITPIYRSDASGTTYNFTEYLSSASSTFKSRIGKGTQVNFSVGQGGKGSSGVSAVLSKTNGGITYVDVAYSVRSHFKFFAVQNRAGKYVLPGNGAITAAAKGVKRVPANNELSIVNPPKTQKGAYPICTFTYVILPLKTDNASDLRKFVFWALTSGQQYGPKLRFVAVPKPVLVVAEKTLRRVHA
jgi:phosphate transport system substrate-binding protein